MDEAAIRADYLRNNALTESLREVIARGDGRRQPELDVDAVRPVLEVRAEYLDAAYDEVRRVHGSFGAYLRDGLGWTTRCRRAAGATAGLTGARRRTGGGRPGRSTISAWPAA